MIQQRFVLVVALLGLAATAQAQLPPPPPPPLLPPPVPAGNPVTSAKTNLGLALFWDEQLSTSGTTSCGTCHIPTRGGSDPRSSATNPAARHPGPDGIANTVDDVIGSPGVARQDSAGAYVGSTSFGLAPQVTGRKTPSMINAAYAATLFWDGRADGSFEDPVTGAVVLATGAALESQVAGPPVSDVEMGHVGSNWTEVAQRIQTATPLRLSPQIPLALSTWIAGRTYPALFQEAFGTPDVTPARIALAIATYERTLFSNQAPIDQFVAGQPPPLTQQELQGQQIFVTVGRCAGCHVGPRFTNDTFQYIGVRPQNDDLGRFAVTNNPADRGRMKVPSLRNVELRGPYFHNGEMATLEAVVDFYDRGGDFNAPNKNPLIAPIGLTPAQKAALVAFLKRPLTDPRVVAGTGPFERPLLNSESPRQPALFGVGTAGLGGSVPRMIAHEPAVLGNANFTLALDRAAGGATARLLISLGSLAQPVSFHGAGLYLPRDSSTRWLAPTTLAGTGAGNGFASQSLTLPTDSSRIGTSLFAQWLVFENALGGATAASEAVQFTLF